MSTSSAEPHRQPPRRHSGPRRAFFKAFEHLAARLGGRAFYRHFFLGPGRFEVRHECVPCARPELAGLRIVQLSDLHAGSFLGTGDLAHVVAAIQALAPDLIVFTGDLIARRTEEALFVLDDLAQLECRGGVLAVFGNHDYRGRREGELVHAFGAHGIRFLRNEGRHPLPGLPLFVLGVEDLEEARDLDVRPARAALVEGDFELILCHNPHGVAALLGPHTGLCLSGHAHGNQIDLPLLRRIGPGHPGDRLELVGPRGAAPLITSRGLGVVGLPLRVRARPDIVCVELVAPTRGAEPR